MPLYACFTPESARAIADITAVPCGKSTSSCSRSLREVTAISAHDVGQQERQRRRDADEHALPSLSDGAPTMSRSAKAASCAFELTGDGCHPLRPRCDRIRGLHL